MPDRLLVPAYLPAVPRAVIDGRPLRFCRAPDSSFRIGSLGFNGRGDHGTPERNPRGEDDDGDWVWWQRGK